MKLTVLKLLMINMQRRVGLDDNINDSTWSSLGWLHSAASVFWIVTFNGKA